MPEITIEPEGLESLNIQPFKDLKTEDLPVETESQPFILLGIGRVVFKVSSGYLGQGIDIKPFAFTKPARISVEVELIEDPESRRTFHYWRNNLMVRIYLKDQKTLYGFPNEANDIPNRIIFDSWSTKKRVSEYTDSHNKTLAPNPLIVSTDEIHNLRFQFVDSR